MQTALNKRSDTYLSRLRLESAYGQRYIGIEWGLAEAEETAAVGGLKLDWGITLAFFPTPVVSLGCAIHVRAFLLL